MVVVDDSQDTFWAIQINRVRCCATPSAHCGRGGTNRSGHAREVSARTGRFPTRGSKRPASSRCRVLAERGQAEVRVKDCGAQRIDVLYKMRGGRRIVRLFDDEPALDVAELDLVAVIQHRRTR